MKKLTLSKNTIFNLIGSICPLLVAVVVAPLILNNLGFTTMSKLALLWGIWGAFNLLDLGFTRAITYRVAKSRNFIEQKKIITSGLIATGCFSAFLTVILVALVKTISSVQAELLERFGWTEFELIATAISLFPTLMLTGLRGVLEGLNKFKASNINRSLIGLTIYGLPAILLLPGHPSMDIYIFFNLVARMLLVFGTIWSTRRLLTKLNISMVIEEYYKLFQAGVWVFLSGLIIPILMYGDRFIINLTLGNEALSYYGLMQEGVVKLLIFPGAFASALFYFNTHENRSCQDLLELTNRLTKLIAPPAFMGVALGFFLVPDFTTFWLSNEATQAIALPTQIMLIGVLASSLALPPLMALFALGEFKLTFYIYLTEFALFVAVQTFFFGSLSINQFSLIWTARCIFDLGLIYLALLSRTRKATPDRRQF